MQAEAAPPADPHPIDRAGTDAALLSGIEIGLGSLLHGLHLPLAGHLLSLNQGFLLSRSVLSAPPDRRARTLPFSVSSIAALLKSLSPAGKKLTPMLGISAQGCLFGLGTLLCGPGAAGVLIGSAACSLWGFLQPLLIYRLLYGTDLWRIGDRYLGMLTELAPVTRSGLARALAALVVLKLLASLALAWAALRLPQSAFDRYRRRMWQLGSARRQRLQPPRPTPPGLSRSRRWGGRAWLALKDLLHPLFLVSLVMSGVFFRLNDVSWSQTLWSLLRPVAGGFLLFLAVRTLPLERLATPRSGSGGFSASVQRALALVRRP